MISTPVAFWNLNNTRIDNVGGVEIVSGDGLEHYVPGKIGQAYDAFGANRRLAQSFAFNFAAKWSYSFWFYCTSWASNHYAVISRPSAALQIKGQTGNRVTVSCNGTVLNSVAVITLNAWNHVVVTFDPDAITDRLTLWVNGISISGGSTATGANTETDVWYAYGIFGQFPGLVDSLGFWDQVLTVDEVAELYNAGNGWEYTPLDNTPDAFDFADVTDADLSTEYVSDSQTITGMDAGTVMSVTGGEYRLDGGAWTSDAGTINPGQTLELLATSSTDPETAVTVSVTVGTLTVDWIITTKAGRTLKQHFVVGPDGIAQSVGACVIVPGWV